MKTRIYALNPQSLPISQDLGKKNLSFPNIKPINMILQHKLEPMTCIEATIYQKTSEFQFSSFWKVQKTAWDTTTPQPYVYSFIGQQRIQWHWPGFVIPFTAMSVALITEPSTGLYVILVNPRKMQNVRMLGSSWFPQSGIKESSFWVKAVEERFLPILSGGPYVMAASHWALF